MTEAAAEPRTVVVEREIPFPAERIWRALTQPHLMSEWLMKTDFTPDLGHEFKFQADWGSVDCRVLEVEQEKTLAYTWEAMGLESTVTWTLTPRSKGTHLRMEHTGFRPDQNQAFHGARKGWQHFINSLEQTLVRMD